MKRPEFRPRHLFAVLVAMSALLIPGTAHAAPTANGALLTGSAAKAKPSKTAKASPTDPGKIRSQLSRLGDEYAASERTLGALAKRKDLLDKRMAATKKRLARLHSHVAQMAVAAYMGGQVDNTMVVLADTSSGPDQVVQRLTTLSMMSSTDDAAMSAARHESSRLAGQRNSLAEIRKQAKAEQKRLAEKKKKLNAALLAAARAAADRANGASRDRPIMKNGGACPVGSPYTVMNTFGAARGGGRAHEGDDLPAPKGTPIYAVENGTISRAYSNTLGGIAIILDGKSGDSYYYAHQEVNLVHTGEHVVAGQMIARVGMTGDAQGTIYHLHFERWPNGGSAVDPYPFVIALCGKKG